MRRILLLPTSEAALLQSLVGYWDFETLTADRGPNGLTLTNNNSVTQVAGKVGQAANFVAASSQYFSRASSALLQTGDIDFSLACWIYLSAKSGTHQVGPARWGIGGGGAEREYYLIWLASNDRFSFRISSDGTNEIAVTADLFGAPSTATWVFLTAWHDSIANTLNIQVNGGGVDSLSHSSGVRAGLANFELGRNDKGLGGFLNGSLDEVMFSKRVWTAAERTWLYAGGAGRSWTEVSTYRTIDILIENTLAWLWQHGRRVPHVQASLPQIPLRLRGRGAVRSGEVRRRGIWAPEGAR